MRSEFSSNPVPEHIQPTHSAFSCTRHLERNAELGISFHIFEKHLLTAAVVEFRGAAVGAAGDALSGFEGAIVFQKVRDARRPK